MTTDNSASREQWFIIPVNPEPWKVPPMSAGRRKGGLYVAAGLDQQGEAFKEAVRESLREQNAYMMKPPYSIEFWFDRQLTEGRHQVDVTNMQKLAEDALQGVVIDNDRNVININSHGWDQNEAAFGLIIVQVTDNAEKAGIPRKMMSKWLEVTTEIHNGGAKKVADKNTWP